MDSSDRDAKDALTRPQDLLSRGPKKWRSPWRKQVRWWNLALGGVIVGAAIAILAPLQNPAYRSGFAGNLVSSAWQLIVGAAAGWIAFKRFKAERFDRVISITWDSPFEQMLRFSTSLYPMAIVEAADLRGALDTELRRKILDVATRGRWRGALYGRFLEIEQVVDIDGSCDAAEILATIDAALPDPKFMRDAIRAICELYVCSSRVLGYQPSGEFINPLYKAIEDWSALLKAL